MIMFTNTLKYFDFIIIKKHMELQSDSKMPPTIDARLGELLNEVGMIARYTKVQSYKESKPV